MAFDPEQLEAPKDADNEDPGSIQEASDLTVQ